MKTANLKFQISNLALLVLTAIAASAQPVPPTTAFTRYLLSSTNQAQFLDRTGVTNAATGAALNSTNKLDTDLRSHVANTTNGLNSRLLDTNTALVTRINASTNNTAQTWDAEVGPIAAAAMATNSAGSAYIATKENKAVSGMFTSWELTQKILTTNANYDAGGLRVSSIIYDRDGLIRMYYAGYSNSLHVGANSAGRIIGAFGTSIDALGKHGVVVDRGTAGQWDSGNIGSARIFNFGTETNYMYYFASTNTTFETGWQGCGVAYTTNGTNFTKYSGNPILNIGTGGSWDAVAIQGGHYVVKYNGIYYLFFSGKNAGGDESVGLAFSDSPLGPFTKYSGNPIANHPSQIAVEPSVFPLGENRGWAMVTGDGAYAMYWHSVDLTNWTHESNIEIVDPTGQFGQGSGAGYSPFLFWDNGPVFLMDDTASIYVLRPKQSAPYLPSSVVANNRSTATTLSNNLSVYGTFIVQDVIQLDETVAAFGTVELSVPLDGSSPITLQSLLNPSYIYPDGVVDLFSSGLNVSTNGTTISGDGARGNIRWTGTATGNGSGLTNILFKTNYVAANFAPSAGYIKFVGSNNALFAVSATKTNLISAP